jgi:outer membrane protein OmpA-like peptidoglycan-associated protein
MQRFVILTLTGAVFLVSVSCSSLSRTQKGAIIGATSGGVVGGAIGKVAGNTAVGAIMGAAIGGAAGAYVGHYMDKQAAEMERDIADARIERVGEGIKITFDSGLLFDVDKATLKPASNENLAKLSVILNKYDDTNILLEGHSDATGPEEYNLELSRKRGQSVSNYLASLSVNPTRFTVMGYGESQPVASNQTKVGRQRNRRVEVAIYATEKLKKVAKAQTG